jgi:hypothetical protein
MGSAELPRSNLNGASARCGIRSIRANTPTLANTVLEWETGISAADLRENSD